MLIGSHVGMKGKDMFLGSVKEALSYGANTFIGVHWCTTEIQEEKRLRN